MIERRDKTAGFTLVEMMVVVIIMGLLATGAVLSFAGPLHAARTRQLIDTIRDADTQARNVGRRLGRTTTLRFDLNENSIQRFDSTDGVATWTRSLPSRCTFTEARLGADVHVYQTLSVTASQMGLTPTYALRVGCGKDEKFWLVFSGLGGQMIETNDESQVQKMLDVRE